MAMNKIFLMAVALSLAFAATVTNVGAATSSSPALVKGGIIKLDTANLSIKDDNGKEWTFRYDQNVKVKEYKVGDSVEAKYDKENLRAITKTSKFP